MSDDASDQVAPRPAAHAAPTTTENFLCPLCLDLIWQPVGLHCCGASFCLSCIRSSIRASPSCPLCRKACYLNAAAVRPNLFLSQALETLFPAEVAERKAVEAAAIAAGQRSDQVTDAKIGLFLFPFQRGGQTRLPPPGSPVAFKFFEPRYVLMAKRASENNVPFGLMPTVDSPHGGVTISISTLLELPGGLLVVEGKVEQRFRLLAPAEMSSGEFGLWSALVEPYSDYPSQPAPQPQPEPEDDRLEPILRDLPLKLSTKAKLRRLGATSKTAVVNALKNALADVVVRVIAGLSPAIVTGVLRRAHGDTPAPAAGGGGGADGSAQRWSFYCADILALSTVRMVKEEEQRGGEGGQGEAGAGAGAAPAAVVEIDAATEAMTTRSTLRRLALCYCFLELVAAETREAARSSRQDAANDGNGNGHDGNDAADGNNNAGDDNNVDAPLSVFPELGPASATRLFFLLNQDGGGGFQGGVSGLLTPSNFTRAVIRGFGLLVLDPGTFFRNLLRNPAVSSLLIFVLIVSLLFFFGGKARRGQLENYHYQQ